MKTVLMAIFILLPVAAQDIKLPASLDRLQDKATEAVNVTLDPSMLQMAARFLSDKSADEVKVKKLVSGLRGIYVRSFEFDKEGEYDKADVESVRSQLRGPGWSRIVEVKGKGELSEVYLRSENGKISGLVVIAAEPKELTIVNILGEIDPSQLSDLSGHFGVPKMDVPTPKKSAGKDD